MRRGITFGLFAAAVVLVLQTADGGDAAKAREIIARGIKAAGGEAAVKKQQSSTMKEKGKYYGMGEGLPYTGNYAMQWPDKFRMEIEGVFTIVVNGKKGWMKAGDMVKELSKEEFDQQLESLRVGWITTLVPLKDKAYSLDVVGESKVEGKPAIGVRVTAKELPDVTLFFDTNTGLLIKAEYRTKSQEQGFKEVNQEVFYSDHREVDGAQVPAKLVIKRDGKIYLEAENYEVKSGPIDAGVFAMP